MAWDPVGKNAAGVEEYSGDVPSNAMRRALSAAAAQCSAKAGRLPTPRELVQGLMDALRDAPEGSLLDAGARCELLDRWDTVSNAAGSSKKRPSPRAGDLLAIPYSGGGRTAIYGWVLHVPAKGSPAAKSYGICVLVLDRDVGTGDVLDEVVRAPALLGPLLPGDEQIRNGTWRIIGNVQADFEAMLPIFEGQVPRGGKLVPILTSYLGAEVEDTPENRRRVRTPTIGGASWIPSEVRSARGTGRNLGETEMLANGRRR